MAAISRNTDAARAEKLIAGTKQHFANVSSLAFSSGTFTPTQIETSLQQLATLRTDVDAAKVALEAKLATEADQADALRAFMLAFVQFVMATFSKSPDVLADFGLQPTKTRTPLTVEQKAAAAAKRKATRAARGTKGAKAKLAITGDVTGVTVTPTTTPQPAGSGNGGTGTQGSGSAPGTPTGTPPHS